MYGFYLAVYLRPQRSLEDIPYHFKIDRPCHCKMVWYVLLRSLRPELDGQMSFKFMVPRLPTIITRTLATFDFLQEKMCQIKLTQDGFEEFVKKWKDYHNNLVKILGLLLGFYVSTMMGRWWKQITNLPRIEDLAMALNGLIQPGIKGAQAALEFKKRLLRHALLSYTLMMITISPPMRKMYGTGDKIVRKGLATWDDGAINRLRKDQGSNFGWMDKWWLPINWCCQLVQEESGSDLLHVPRDGKEILRRLIHFKETCFEVAEYTHNPLPASQAVYFVCWTFLILGAFAYQPCNGGESSSWWLLEVFH
jgi:hypothetical protein